MQTEHATWPFPVHFGDDTTSPIPIIGDIVDAIYLRIVWPIQGVVNNSVATAMINFVELIHQSNVIERIYGENMFIWNELTVAQGKRAGLQKLVGIDTTTSQSEYYLHLPFTIKLPLCALNIQPDLRIVFNTPDKFMAVPYKNEIDLETVIDYVFLGDEERSYIQNNPQRYLTQSYQVLQFSIQPNQTNFKTVTSFVNNVKELFWIIQDQSPTDMYDYNDDLINMSLSFNGIEFLSNTVANNTYVSIIQPLEYHTRTPTSNVYLYSFALNPELQQPTGEINMTFIYNQNHAYWVRPSTKLRYIRIYALGYNVATIDKGELSMMHTINESGFKN